MKGREASNFAQWGKWLLVLLLGIASGKASVPILPKADASVSALLAGWVNEKIKETEVQNAK